MNELLTFNRLKRHPAAIIGTIGSMIVVLIALIGPYVAPYDVAQAGMVLRVQKRLIAPSSSHLMGTDHLGTDVFSLILHGASSSIKIGLGAAFLCTILGASIGLLAGFFGGAIDMALMRTIDVFLAFPSLVLAILIAASLGPGTMSITLALVLTGWPALARVIRGAVLGLKKEEYILASRAIGCSKLRIITHHLLPNCLPLIVVLFSMRVGVMILGEASLSFLGLGTPAGSASWGVMVDTGRSYIGLAPWCSIAPATAIAVTVLTFNFLGDGLRDLLDPRLRGRL